MTDEEKIIAFAQKKDQQAFSDLYLKYHHMVFFICLKYVKKEDLAQDLCAGVFENLFLKANQYQIKNFKSWLYQSAKNAALMHIRDKKMHLDGDHDMGQVPMEEESIDHQKREEQENRLTYCIGLLKDAQKFCVEQFFFQKQRYQSIAQSLNIPEKQVKSHLQNAKKNLKKCMNHE